MSGPAAATTGSEPTEPSTRWRGFWGRCLIAVLVASAFMGSAVALVDRSITDRVQKIRRVNLTLASSPPGGANYLIIGSDTRAVVDPSDQAGLGNTEQVQGQRSDTLMVAHVEPSAQRTFVVSFPRDLIVNVPTVGRTRINEAYAQGGPQLVIDTLKQNFDIDISHYLEVDFKSFQEIVNEIGNIGVYLPGTVRDQETGLYVPYGKGCYALDGASALAYVRSRSLEIYDPNYTDANGEHWRTLDVRADLDRIQRQQSFIRKLAGLAISKSLSDPFLAVSLADNVIGYLKADQNLSRDDVNALIRAFKTVDVNDPNSVRFETLPVDPDPNNPLATLVPAAAADAVVEQLRTFGDDTPKPPTVAPSHVTVHVTDATGTNVAPSVVTELAAQGFHASQAKTATATATIPVTEIRYGYGQAEEAKTLLAYFPDAKFVPDASAKDAVELVLGTSFAGDITVPSTTTTVPATTVPGEPVTTAPAAPTTTAPPTTTTTDPTAACPN